MLKTQPLTKSLSVLFFGKQADEFPSRGRVIFITRKIQLHREGKDTCLAREKVDSREAVFFMPEFQFRDGIPSLRSHPGVTKLTVYRQFSGKYMLSAKAIL